MANKSYTVLFGSFRGADDTLIGQGGVIELPDDVAERFSHQLELVPVETAPAAAPAGEGGGRKPTAKADQDA